MGLWTSTPSVLPSTQRRTGSCSLPSTLALIGQDLRGHRLMERRVLLRKMIKQFKRSPIQFSDHVEGDGGTFFKAAAELGLESIVSKRVVSRYHSGSSRSWLKIKNMVESEFILLGTEPDSDGVPSGAVGIRSGWPEG